PADTTAVEGGSARFSVRLASVGVYGFQWRRNGAPLSGATGPDYEYGPVRMSDQGARFSCYITNNLGTVTSREAVLTVTPDTVRPRLVEARNLGLNQVEVTFSEPVSAPSATTAANYRLDGGVGVTGAAYGGSAAVVILTTSTLSLGTLYTLTVDGVLDQAQVGNPIAPGSTVSFVAVEYATVDLGNPPLAGVTTPVVGGMDLAGSGELGGTADTGAFAWKRVSGDFDERGRLAAFDPTDPFAQGGLMVRETLEANARFAAALATPATVGCYLLSRSNPGATANRAGFFPANYPDTWLRLRRVGNQFTGYASYDGQRWTQLGSAALSMPSTVYLGWAVGSRDNARRATVSIREVGRVTGGSVVAYTPRGETLGPSSRLTPLVISEVMYHPAERMDGRKGEFIELYNADLIAQDLTGHRLSGSVDFGFPDGYRLPAGGFAVVARDPADLGAIYGLTGVLGPFASTNNLPNDQGTIRLRNPQGAVLLEVEYGSRAPWPVAADGTGHSLVLARPSYGEGDVRAWGASDRMGGSPGRMESVRANPFGAVLINEWLAHTDLPQLDFVELYNRSNEPVDLADCVLTDDPGTNRFRIPAGTVLTPRGFVAFDEVQLGFRLNAAGETIYLFDPSRTRVVDAVRFGAQENGVASGRSPDGTPETRRLGWPTPAAENAPWRVSEVAINEIMYHPLSGDNADEYVELYNRTAQAIDLAGWEFTDGISYRFSAGAVLGPGGYAVVARDRVRLLANHPTVSSTAVFGDFGGTLANGGERLALAKPDVILSTNEFGVVRTNRIAIEVDEVTYGTGGRWGRWSDGLGSSLELIDPHSDHRQASNWADSDESAKAPWSTIEFTGRLDHGDGGSANRLQIMLQGPGECLVDDVEVIPSGGANRLSNSAFESGAAGWTIQGNHRASALEAGTGVGGTACLHVRATGRGDTAVNRIFTAINPALANNSTATLRARVRWLKGWPEFMLRIRGSYLEAADRMLVPANLGTPGARNSRAVLNAGPAIFDVTHAPVLPASGQAVLVTARLTDPDGVGSARLRYRVDPGSSLATVLLRDDGTSGDDVAGDGVYSARIPGQSAGTLVAFHVEATDAPVSGAATARFPAEAPTRECLVRWGESQPVGNLGVYRLWQRRADYDWLRQREPLANDNLDATFVYNDARVIYNFEMRAKGSPWHSGSVGSDYVFAFPDDDRFLGARDLALVTVGNLGNDDSAQREQAAFWIGRQMGIPTLNRRHVFFFENGAQKQKVYEDAEEPNGYYADRWWPEGPDGDLYKIEDWFEFPDDPRGRFTFSRDATLQSFTTTGGAYKLARYRWAWRKRAVVYSANDYTHFFNLVTAVNQSAANLVAQVENLVDVEVWMRNFALQHSVGNWDAYGYNRGKNAYIYRPINGRFQMIPWDIDFVLGSGSDGPSTDIFGANDPTVSRLWNTPAFQRVYLRAYLDAIAGPLQNANFDPIVEGRYAALRANGVSVAQPNPIKSWVAQRRNYLANRVASFDTPALAITSNNGNNFSTSQAVVNLTGRAPIALRTLTVNGVPVPVTWSTTVNWTLPLALASRQNVLNVGGLDTWGRPIPGMAARITIDYTGAQLPSPAGQIVINEIMYHPAVRDAEFIELWNTSTTATFDLANWRLEGAGFTFPPGAVLGPGAYAVITQNRDAFAAAHGFAVLPMGEFPGALQNDGERLRLVRPGASPSEDLMVDEVRYDSEAPWPAQANGGGPSLQLIDPLVDNWSVGNWAAARTNDTVQATPGRANSVANSLPAFPLVYLNEVQAVNVNGPRDRWGDRDPWLELHNPGATAVDLGGLYLTSDYNHLTQWAFPAGTTIGSGEFLRLWVDGEPAESVPSELHTSFRLAPGSGAIALVRLQRGAPVVFDYLNYKSLPDGLSFGSYPDGQPRERRLFHLPTPGAANNPAAPQVQVFVNEWLASNTGVILDPADQDPDDWFELYNAGTAPVDLSAYTLTDTLTDRTKSVIPNGTVIPPGGFLLVWADEETGQTTATQLHVNFRLAAAGEAIGLFAPDGTPVDQVTFGPQADNISQGRFPDGSAEPFWFMDVPSPGRPNVFAAANQPPVLAPIGNRLVDEGQRVTFTAGATDPDAGQTLTFSLAGAPAGAAIDPVTGVFSWSTAEADGPGEHTFTVRATDNGSPPRWAAQSVTITVREVNQAPVLESIVDRVVDERTLLVFTVRASDPDLPRQQLQFSLAAGGPAGAAIHPLSGEFAWRPTEEQGPGEYTLTAIVTDDGAPALSASQAFRVTVTEVDDPPEFGAVDLQTVEELALFSLALQARDPDTPPRSVRYTIEAGPSGLAVDALTGLVTWTPTEDQGPNSYNVVVRATESGGGGLSTSFAFSIVVSEKNEPPQLAPIPDVTVGEGAVLTFTSVATDADRPAQQLSFSLEPGAPPGASVDPQSGVFNWPIGVDVPPSTNRITIRVTDDAIEARSASQTFTVVVVAQVRIVINEIMYRPDASGAEFVELHNGSASTAWSLEGWRLAGYDFAFPAGTVLAPGAYLAVAKNVVRFRTVYGTAVPVVGDYVDRLGSLGGWLGLWRPATGGEELVDWVSFSARAPWPAAANGGGPSLQLLDPSQDNARVANWAAVSGVSTNAPRNVIPASAVWRYWQEAANPASGWTNLGYDDSAWPSGGALLYVEDAALPWPKTTPLTLGQMSYYFRTRFQFAGNPEGASLQLLTVIDDGAVFYLNGKELPLRLGMAQGVTVERSTPANRTVNNAIAEGPLVVPVDNLLVGENVLAVEVHQTNPGSSDIAFGLSAEAIEVRRESATPGRANSVRASLEPFPEVWLNEVLAQNTTGLRDRVGDRDPWIELHNAGAAAASLQGWFLSDSYGNLTRWPFPEGASLAAGQYRVVWTDGEPAESTASEWHTNFRLAPASGVVVLARLQNGQPAVVDYLEYFDLGDDEAFGYPSSRWLNAAPALLPAPTPGAANNGAPAAPPHIATLTLELNGGITLRWSAITGRRYRLEATSSLGELSWQPVGEVTAAGVEAALTDTVPGPAPQRYYRVVMLP
ncbi:MAG: hypothetical protein FJ387_16980, partial [Verrucomicrobia bacterium]|nr:hypothetical protein [Verrucomicrobiota bacterium]